MESSSVPRLFIFIFLFKAARSAPACIAGDAKRTQLLKENLKPSPGMMIARHPPNGCRRRWLFVSGFGWGETHSVRSHARQSLLQTFARRFQLPFSVCTASRFSTHIQRTHTRSHVHTRLVSAATYVRYLLANFPDRG